MRKWKIDSVLHGGPVRSRNVTYSWNACVWNSRDSRFPSGVYKTGLYVSEKRGWLRTGGSFYLSFKERWPLKGGNSSLSSRTWNRVKSFSSSLPLPSSLSLFSLSLSLSPCFLLASRLFLSRFPSSSRGPAGATRIERRFTTLTRFGHLAALLARLVDRLFTGGWIFELTLSLLSIY